MIYDCVIRPVVYGTGWTCYAFMAGNTAIPSQPYQHGMSVNTEWLLKGSEICHMPSQYHEEHSHIN